MKMKKILALLLAMAMIFAVFSACGNDAASSAAAPASETESASAPEAQPEPPAQEVPPETPEAPASAEEPASTEEDAPSEGDLITTSYVYDLPLFDESRNAELSMWVSFSDNMSTFMPNQFADNKGYMRAEELTGVHVDLECVSTASNSEQFNLRVTSGDLPNIITNAEDPNKAVVIL